MNKIILRIFLAITPSIVKQYFERRISSLRQENDFLRTGIREAYDAEGYRLSCNSYEELYKLSKKQMSLRQRKLHSQRSVSMSNGAGLKMPLVARIFRAVSKWLSRWAKSLDHNAAAGKMVSENGKPQLKLELEK